MGTEDFKKSEAFVSLQGDCAVVVTDKSAKNAGCTGKTEKKKNCANGVGMKNADGVAVEFEGCTIEKTGRRRLERRRLSETKLETTVTVTAPKAAVEAAKQSYDKV